MTAAATTPTPLLRVRALNKRFGAFQALRGVDFELGAGEFLTLLGPSGSGKTTTLMSIAGFVAPTSGDILYQGASITGQAPEARGFGMVFQGYALFPHMTVEQNVRFPLAIRGVGREQARRRAQQALEQVQLGSYGARYPRQLSGGQQQRVALGRAVISEAPVCLMDEPLSNLDAQLRHDMRREIRALQQELGITMVYVTHDQTEAMSMADQVVLMRGGRIEQLDTPDGLYARPATEFAARFIGTPPMNLIALDTHDGRPVVAGTQGPALANAPAGAVTLGLRPEHIRIDADGMPAVIESVEYFGADSVAVCRLGSCGGVAVRVNGHLRSAPGTAVGLAWPDERQHFFAADAAVL